MTEDEKRRGYLMMSAVFRPLTEVEREELVALVTPDPEPTDYAMGDTLEK